jgi:hypothetical protein
VVGVLKKIGPMLDRVRVNRLAAHAAQAAKRCDQIALGAPVQFHRATTLARQGAKIM